MFCFRSSLRARHQSAASRFVETSRYPVLAVLSLALQRQALASRALASRALEALSLPGRDDTTCSYPLFCLAPRAIVQTKIALAIGIRLPRRRLCRLCRLSLNARRHCRARRFVKPPPNLALDRHALHRYALFASA